MQDGIRGPLRRIADASGVTGALTAGKAKGLDVDLSAIVAVDNEAFLLSVQNNVLRIDTPMPENVGDAALSLSREDLLDVVTRVQGLSDIAGWDQGEAAMLAGLIE